MRAFLVVAVLLIASIATAHKKTALSRADQQRYAKTLQRGRALQGTHDFTGAITAFEACLAIAPDDPVALSEIGWSAYLAHDNTRAETATRAALANQAGPAVRGSTLYNLGLIEEAKGDRAAAIAAYSESLHVRPNTTVRAALAKLDAAAAATFEPLQPARLAGPFKTIEAYCKTIDVAPAEPWITCACGTTTPATASKVEPPFAELAVFTRVCNGTPPSKDDDVGDLSYKLALRTSTGWFVQDLESRHYGRNCFETEQSLTYEAHVADVIPGGTREALVTTTSKGTCWHGDADWDDAALIVVGIGPSRAPSGVRIATKRFDRSDANLDPNGNPNGTWNVVDADVSLDVAWAADGALQLSGKTKGLDKGEEQGVLGKHTLVFP